VEGAGSIATRPAVEGGVAVLIVKGPLLRVAKDLVGFAELLEVLLGRFVARVLVRMILDRQATVRFLDLVVLGLARDLQDLVII
jgi:hypothetical protein